MKQQGGVVQDRCPDIVQASGGYAVDVLTGMKLEVAKQVQVDGEVRVGSEVLVMEDDLAVALSEGKL